MLCSVRANLKFARNEYQDLQSEKRQLILIALKMLILTAAEPTVAGRREKQFGNSAELAVGSAELGD